MRVTDVQPQTVTRCASRVRTLSWQEQHVQFARASGFGQLARLLGRNRQGDAGDRAVRAAVGVHGGARAAERLISANLEDPRAVQDLAGMGLVSGLVDNRDQYLDGI